MGTIQAKPGLIRPQTANPSGNQAVQDVKLQAIREESKVVGKDGKLLGDRDDPVAKSGNGK